MSKIAEQLNLLSSYNKSLTITLDSIIENSTIRDIKEYIIYLQKENKNKDKQIKELITENVTLQVKLETKK